MTWSDYIHNPAGPKFYLEKVRLDEGGYSMHGEAGGGGKYFGNVPGTGIWYYDAVEGSEETGVYYEGPYSEKVPEIYRPGYVRASSRSEAKRKVREIIPGARFYS